MAQNIQAHKTPETMSKEELRTQLLTADYGGKEWKAKCLAELIRRAEDAAINSFKEF
jgi:hypothetical protein